MYAKIFQSIYDGTLGKDWHVRTVFQDFLILADKEGIVDMTTEAISRRTGVPLKIVRAAVRKLEEPDEESRNPNMNGRRIERLDNHRPWGWRIINYKYYRNLCSLEQKRANDIERLAKKREAERQEKLIKSDSVATCRISSQPVADVAHTDTDTDTYAVKKKSSAKGSRFALSQLPEEWAEFCLKARPDLNPASTFDCFRDYWQSQPLKGRREEGFSPGL